MRKYYANPYDTSATGFYFDNFEDYIVKSNNHRCEEFMIDYIDGNGADLFKACGINQSNLEQWFDDVETLADSDKPALFFLMDNNIVANLADAIAKIDYVQISEQRLEDEAAELFDECYLHDVPEAVRNYIDYDAFARDCQMGGDMCEFVFNGTTYTCTNANSI